MEIEGLEIDSCQCQLHASRCIPSCKLVLCSSGTLISGCSHTSDSQSVRGSEDGPSGAAPSCAVSGPAGPALPQVAITYLESACGPETALLSEPTSNRSELCGPQDQDECAELAGTQPGG